MRKTKALGEGGGVRWRDRETTRIYTNQTR